MTWLYVLIIIGVLVVAVKIFDLPIGQDKKKSTYRYQRKDYFMTPAEHKFFDILVALLGDRYYVFPQVHLSTILDNKVKGQNWRGAFRHIDEKSVDFVICDKAYIKPLLAIELDDSSHERAGRQDRDAEVERIFKEVGLPLLRLANQNQYNKDEIRNQIFQALNIT